MYVSYVVDNLAETELVLLVCAWKHCMEYFVNFKFPKDFAKNVVTESIQFAMFATYVSTLSPY